MSRDSNNSSPQEYKDAIDVLIDALVAAERNGDEQTAQRVRDKLQINSTLLVAAYLAEMHVCGHGNRGWCPLCAMLVNAGVAP